MSVQALSWVFEQSATSGVTRCVLMVVANRIGDHDGDEYCYPSIDRIAKEANCSRRAAIDGIHRAEELGELGVERNAGLGGANVYRLPRMGGGAESAPVQMSGANLHPNHKELGSSSSSSSSSSLPTPSRPASRVRDVLADALARAEGADPSEVTASRMRTLCVKANELRKLNPDITAAEVARRASHWSSHFHQASISGPAIVEHWGRLAHPGGGNGSDSRAGAERILHDMKAADRARS